MNLNDYNKVADRIVPSERCRNEVLNMNKRRKKHIKLNKRGFALIAVAAVAACGGTAVFAAERMGVFDKLGNNLESSYVDSEGNEFQKDKWEHHDIEQIGAAAQTFTSPIPLEGDNISLTVESVYCDRNTLILGLTGSLNNGNPDGWQYINFDPVLKMDDRTYSHFLRNGIIDMQSKLYLDEGTENSFSGQLRFTFGSADRINEPKDVEFKINTFRPSSNYYGVVSEDTPVIEDEFCFSLNIAPDESLIRSIDHTFTDSAGYSITIFDITPSAMQVQRFSIEEEHYPYQQENPNSKVYEIWTDGNGKELEWIGLSGPLKLEDGTYATLLQPPTDDIINIKFYDANTQGDDGEPLFINEMTIDLENLAVIE